MAVSLLPQQIQIKKTNLNAIIDDLSVEKNEF